MVRRYAAFQPSTRPKWAPKGIKVSHDCPAPDNFVNREMLKIVDFRLSVDSDLAAGHLHLPVDVAGRQARTEIRWAWLRVERATGAGWVRVDHVYSPVEYRERQNAWDHWYTAHQNGYIFTRRSTWVSLPEFIATYPRFQRMPNQHLPRAVPSFVATGPFRYATWWRQAPADDMIPRSLGQEALLGGSCDFDMDIWVQRVKQGNPERVLNARAAYDTWWRMFGVSGQFAT